MVTSSGELVVDSGENLQVVADFGRLGGRDLALLVEGLLAADRGHHDRGVVFDAQDLGRHVDLADVDQPPRAELEFQEAFAIGAQRDFVVDAGGHVAEMRGRDSRTHDRLEIEHVDRVLRRLDEILRAQRRPDDGVGKLGPRNRPLAGEGFNPAGGEQRAAGQELQELATAGGLNRE